MAKYVVYQVEVTQAEHSIDGKRHRHKYYLYPAPKRLADFGFKTYWSYKNGKRGALKFNSKAEAKRVARQHSAKVEEFLDNGKQRNFKH